VSDIDTAVVDSLKVLDLNRLEKRTFRDYGSESAIGGKADIDHRLLTNRDL